jgi:MOB kinase activator 1
VYVFVIDYILYSTQYLKTIAAEYPPNFPSTAKHIYRQLLRVFAHIYHAHYAVLLHLSSEPHFNSLFAHFLAFGRQYDLLDMKDIVGVPPHYVGVGELRRKWKSMGILDS